jgi:hypothetical protein
MFLKCSQPQKHPLKRKQLPRESGGESRQGFRNPASGFLRANEAQVDTIRLKLLKIAAQVRITARRIWVRCSCAHPWQNVFAADWTALRW